MRKNVLREQGPGVLAKGSHSYGIVVFSHLRWDFVWQRPQQFLSRFAKRHRILFIEEPYFDAREGGNWIEVREGMPDVSVAAPHLAPGLAEEEQALELRRLAEEAIAAANAFGDFDEPLHWYYAPMMASWGLDLSSRGVVYDCMDELSQFRYAPPALVANERRLMERADIVFTGGYELYAKKSKLHKNVHCFGCGVEYEHFSQAQDAGGSIPEDLKMLGKPVVGWFGVIDERVDYDLLLRAAALRPEYRFAMVGPVVKVDPDSLPKADNLHWLGGRDYAQLPAYCRGFDVCMMCFAINEATQYINPTKALEYMATGKPVVSTPVRDVVRQYADAADVVSSAEEFVRALDRAIAKPDQAKIRRGLQRARQASWDETVDRMNELIDKATRRAEQKAAPVQSLVPKAVAP